MEFNVINPYSSAGLAHYKGLDSIIQCYAGSSSSSSSGGPSPVVPETGKTEKFLDCVASYMVKDMPPATKEAAKTEIVSVAANAINNYGLGIGYASQYSQAQLCVIKEMLAVVNDVPLSSIGDYLQNIQNGIAVSTMSKKEKVPLYIAVSVGVNNYAYWIDKIKNGEGLWTEYLDTLEGIKADMPYYVSAAIEGALGAYGTMGQSCECMPNGDVTAAVTGSLAVGAGKVIFKWMPVKNKPCNEPITYMPAPPTTLPTILNPEDFAPRSFPSNWNTGFPSFPGSSKPDCGCGK